VVIYKCTENDTNVISELNALTPVYLAVKYGIKSGNKMDDIISY
jgi:hypothetical protein